MKYLLYCLVVFSSIKTFSQNKTIISGQIDYSPYKKVFITVYPNFLEEPLEFERDPDENGNFSKTHGTATNKLAMMWMKLVDRYATRGNVRGYTYNDEMRGQAILQLTQIGLQFDESKSNNPFAYYTAADTNSFVRVINVEKRNQMIRDDLLEINGMNPSYTRMGEGEHAAAVKRFDETTD